MFSESKEGLFKLTSILILVILVEFQGIETNVIYFLTSITIVGYQVFNYYRIEEIKKKSRLIKLKHETWYWRFIGFISIIPVYIILLRNPINLLSSVSIILFTVYGLIATLSYKNINYLLNHEGIRELESNKLIKASEIREIQIQANIIFVHTAKYTNELKIHRANLIYPKWDNVVSEFTQFQARNNIVTSQD